MIRTRQFFGPFRNSTFDTSLQLVFTPVFQLLVGSMGRVEGLTKASYKLKKFP